MTHPVDSERAFQKCQAQQHFEKCIFFLFNEFRVRTGITMLHKLCEESEKNENDQHYGSLQLAFPLFEMIKNHACLMGHYLIWF